MYSLTTYIYIFRPFTLDFQLFSIKLNLLWSEKSYNVEYCINYTHYFMSRRT